MANSNTKFARQHGFPSLKAMRAGTNKTYGEKRGFPVNSAAEKKRRKGD